MSVAERGEIFPEKFPFSIDCRLVFVANASLREAE